MAYINYEDDVMDFDDEIVEVDASNLMDQIPSDSLVWFANFGVEAVGIRGDSNAFSSPDAVLFELLKAMHHCRNLQVQNILDRMNLDIYLIAPK